MGNEHLKNHKISYNRAIFLHPTRRRDAMPNPFFFGPKITNPQYFVGREKELKKIFAFLNTEYTGQIQHVSVIGERRIGKSSLLYRLSQIDGAYLPTHEKYRFLYLDLQDPRCHTVSGLLDHILEELHLTRPSKVTLERFYEIIEKEREKNGIWIILLMDEFEKLTERTAEFTNSFYDSLRSLGNNNQLGIITTSQHPLRDLAEQKKLTSPFFNIFHQIQLNEFSEAETQAFLERGRQCDQKFTDADCEKITKIAGKHPARLQMTASLVYEAKSSGKINWKSIEKEAKAEPAFDVNHHAEKKTLKSIIDSVFHWIFVIFPQIVGKAFLEFLGREQIADSTAWLWGTLFLLAIVALLLGFLSWSTITQYIQKIFDLVD